MEMSPKETKSPMKIDLSPNHPRPPPVSPSAPKTKKRKRDYSIGDLSEVLRSLQLDAPKLKRKLFCDDLPRKIQRTT